MKENSIEEDIENAEHFVNSINNDKSYKEEGWHGYINGEIVELARILEHILSNYKRVLKENEELLQEKINNQKIIVLAQNDMLNYQAGFEDGKNGRTSAVQSIIENQQYYIFQKQIEKYERHIEKLQKENEELKKELNEENKRSMMLAVEKQEYFEKYQYHLQQNEHLTREFNNVMLIKKIKDELEELKGKLENISKQREKSKTKEEETVLWCLEIRTDERIKTLQELL